MELCQAAQAAPVPHPKFTTEEGDGWLRDHLSPLIIEPVRPGRNRLPKIKMAVPLEMPREFVSHPIMKQVSAPPHDNISNVAMC
jgi:hypothetical protein